MRKFMQELYRKNPRLKILLSILVYPLILLVQLAWFGYVEGQIRPKSDDRYLAQKFIDSHKLLEKAVLAHSFSGANYANGSVENYIAYHVTPEMKLVNEFYDRYYKPLADDAFLAFSTSEGNRILGGLSGEDKLALASGLKVDLKPYGVSFDRHRLKVARALEAILIDNMRKVLTEGDQPEDRAG